MIYICGRQPQLWTKNLEIMISLLESSKTYDNRGEKVIPKILITLQFMFSLWELYQNHEEVILSLFSDSSWWLEKPCGFYDGYNTYMIKL